MLVSWFGLVRSSPQKPGPFKDRASGEVGGYAATYDPAFRGSVSSLIAPSASSSRIARAAKMDAAEGKWRCAIMNAAPGVRVSVLAKRSIMSALIVSFGLLMPNLTTLKVICKHLM